MSTEITALSKWIRVEGSGIAPVILVGQPNPPVTAEDEVAALNDAIDQVNEYLRGFWQGQPTVFEAPGVVRG